MSEVGKIIEGYRDRHGHPPYASIARAIDVQPQTLDSWRNRGMKTAPRDLEPFRRLAEFVQLDYDIIGAAIAVDIGMMDNMPPYEWPEDKRKRGAS